MADDMTTASEYERDYYTWALTQAEALRAARDALTQGRRNDWEDRLVALDWENLAEEIEALAQRDRRELGSRLSTIIEHLVRLEYSPAVNPRPGCKSTIRRERDEIDDWWPNIPGQETQPETESKTMIKMLSLLTRRPEFTHEQFVKHWHDIHGPLAIAVPGVRRYVQSHIAGTRTRPDIPETDVEVDGIAELWYDDMETAQRAAASPEMKRLTDDGALFIGRIKSYVIDEKQIIPPPG